MIQPWIWFFLIGPSGGGTIYLPYILAQGTNAVSNDVLLFLRPEINIRPWVSLKNELKKGNKKIKWRKRKPYAHWQGNSWVIDNRGDLMKCNVTDKNDWNARLYQVVSCKMCESNCII